MKIHFNVPSATAYLSPPSCIHITCSLFVQGSSWFQLKVFLEVSPALISLEWLMVWYHICLLILKMKETILWKARSLSLSPKSRKRNCLKADRCFTTKTRRCSTGYSSWAPESSHMVLNARTACLSQFSGREGLFLLCSEFAKVLSWFSKFTVHRKWNAWLLALVNLRLLTEQFFLLWRNSPACMG